MYLWFLLKKKKIFFDHWVGHKELICSRISNNNYAH